MKMLTQTSGLATSSLRLTGKHRGLFKQYHAVLSATWLGTDILVALTLLLGATVAEFGSIPPQYRVFAIFVALTMLIVYRWSSLFYGMRMRPFVSEARILLVNLLFVSAILVGLAYFTDTLKFLSGQLLLQWAVATYIGQLAIHATVRFAIHEARKRSRNIRRAVLVGSGSPLSSFVKTLESNPWLGIEVKGYLDLHPNGDFGPNSNLQEAHGTGAEHDDTSFSGPPRIVDDESGLDLKHLGTIDNIEAVVKSLAIDQVYMAVPLEHTARLPDVTQRLLKLNVDVNWVPDLSVFYLVSPCVRELDGRPILCLSDSPLSTSQGPIKWLEDMLLGSLLLLLTAPLMAVIALAIKLTSPGPVLFVQKRHGLNSGVIAVWKFRTMRADNGPELTDQAIKADPRVTPIGRFLRRWSLDELPQLFQVLQGRMSLVGPRPHPLWLDDQYTDVLLGYMQRHRVKPGLTGWAQVNGWRGETDSPEKMDMRLRHDLYYINQWSLLLDFKILVMTLTAVFEGRNAH
jgi:putative colanic acid biosynthesis UDP-glucose lipid carrier transferase